MRILCAPANRRHAWLAPVSLIMMKSTMTYRRLPAHAPLPLGHGARARLRVSAWATGRKASLNEWEAEGGALERNANVLKSIQRRRS